MKKRERNGVSKKYLFCLSDVSLQRYDSANRRPILEKTLFHTVGSCTQWPKQLTCLADGGGWREDQHMWDGQGLKDPCISHVDASHAEWPRIESSLLFCIFFYIVKIIEKSLFSEGEIGFTRKKTSRLGIDIFLNFLTLKTF